MSGLIKPYDRATRMGDESYPGRLRLCGPGWRLAVSPDGARYRLQPRQRGFDVGGWGSPPGLVGATLAALVARAAGVCDGLAQACEGLPDNPALACPDLMGQWAALQLGFRRERQKAETVKQDRRAAALLWESNKRARFDRWS